MTALRQRMIEDMQLRNYAPRTITSYVSEVRHFAEYFGKSPDQLGPDEIRAYQLYLIQEKQVAWSTFNTAVCALRFFYRETLKKEAVVEQLRYAKKPRKLPVVLGRQELERLFRCIPNPMHRMALMTAYSGGLRLSEVLQLQTTDIDSDQMLIHVRQGKGRKNRYVPLSPLLLELLRAYWKVVRPEGYLFPGKQPGHWLSGRTLERVVKRAAKAAGIRKDVTMHTLRHSFATSLLEAGVDIRTIQKLLGHKSLQTTAIYTHITDERVRSISRELDLLSFSDEEGQESDHDEQDRDA